MLSTTTIAEEILELKRDRRAVLLAHHYQAAEIQELADVVGDSLELARKARAELEKYTWAHVSQRWADVYIGRAA